MCFRLNLNVHVYDGYLEYEHDHVSAPYAHERENDVHQVAPLLQYEYVDGDFHYGYVYVHVYHVGVYANAHDLPLIEKLYLKSL